MIVRASELFLPTLRDDPADAEAVSHKLLVRGGFIRQVSAGLWTFMTARLARPPEDRADHPRGARRVRRAGDLHARAHPGRALGGDGTDHHSRALQAQGPQRPRLHPAAHARGDRGLPRARDPVVQGAAADLVPLPDEGPRRAASARRPAARPRVHHEGRLLVRPRRGRARRELPQALRGVQADLRALRGGGPRGRGRVRDDGRERQPGLPRALRVRREHARDLRERRLRGRPRDRRGPAFAGRLPAGAGRARGGGHAGVSGRSRPSRSSSASIPAPRRRRCPSWPTAGSCSRWCAATTGSTR